MARQRRPWSCFMGFHSLGYRIELRKGRRWVILGCRRCGAISEYPLGAGEPRYCDVILARWEQATGRKAEKL